MNDKHEFNAAEYRSPNTSADDAGSHEVSAPETITDREGQRTRPRHSPTIVGIGASAGGLGALKTFFSHVPSDSNLAFVVVVHLSPEHESHLSDLLQPHVNVPVEQVTNTVSNRGESRLCDPAERESERNRHALAAIEAGTSA